jgi:hypothetical protein
MFDRLDFIYLPSDDVAADIAHYTDGLGGEVVFAIERFGTRLRRILYGARDERQRARSTACTLRS